MKSRAGLCELCGGVYKLHELRNGYARIEGHWLVLAILVCKVCYDLGAGSAPVG